MRFLLITTHQYGKRPLAELERLLDSVRSQQGLGDSRIDVRCLLQGVGQLPDDVRRDGHVTYVLSQDLVGLSRARNLVFKSVNVLEHDFVLFPDDDCWYPAGFFGVLVKVLESEGAEFVQWDYEENPAIADRTAMRSATEFDVLRRLNSNTFGCASKVASKIGLFNENLGLGAQVNGGEDTDFAFQAFEIASKRLYLMSASVGHYKFNDGFMKKMATAKKYWPGIMFVNLNHMKMKMIPLLIYRLFVGLFLVSTLNMSVKDFLKPFQLYRMSS